MLKTNYFYSVASLILSVVLSDDFCTDVQEIDKVFFISEFNYLQKDSLMYTFKSNGSLTGIKGTIPGNYFKGSFESIETGFVISKIPNCESNSNYCAQIKKLLNLCFVIGDISGFTEQGYVTYKSDPLLSVITNESLMPFKMKTKAEIDISSSFWPLKSETAKSKYRHSAYVESHFEIIHIIYETAKGSAKEYCHLTTIDNPNGVIVWKKVEPSLSGMNIMFFGFLHTKGIIYSIVKLNNDSFSGVKQSLFSYKGNATFLEEKNIDIRKDLYVCRDALTSTISITKIPSITTLTTLSTLMSESTGTTTMRTTAKEITTQQISGSISENFSSSVIIIIIIVLVIIVVVGVIAAIVIYKVLRSKSPLKETAKATAKEPSNQSNA